mgnify:CR=1 FL=1
MKQEQITDSKRLVLENKRLVHYYAKRFEKNQNDSKYDDYVAEGMIGLIKAANTFDEAKGIKFATYASTCILNEIRMYLRREKKHQSCISIEESIVEDRNSGDKLKIEDILEAPNTSCIENIERQEELEKCIDIIINILNKREIDIIKYTFFQDKKQSEIAKILEISQSYVSRIQKRIRKKIEEYYIRNKRYNKQYVFEISNGFYKVSIYDEKELRVISKSISNPKALEELLTIVSSLKEK